MNLEISSLVALLGGVISILLSIIAYFLKLLHQNFRKVEQDLAAVKVAMQLLKMELKANYNLLKQRMDSEEKHGIRGRCSL